MTNTTYENVLVLAHSNSDAYLGRASGSSEHGFEGEWVNIISLNGQKSHKKLLGFNFTIVESVLIDNVSEAKSILLPQT